MRKLLITLASIIILSSSSFAASQEITLSVNGSIIPTDVNPVAINGRTLVPIRAVSENLGATVGWISEFQEVTLRFSKPNTVIKMKLGSTFLEKDGKTLKMDVPPQAINNRTMIPIRFISETLGFEVLWDNKTHTVNVISKDLEGINEKITFEDKRFEEIIRKEINKPRGDIYKLDVEGIKSLYPAFDTIYSIKGVEHLTNLKTLEVHKNNIKDLTPISNLKNLRTLSIGDNPISNLSPLNNLTNLVDLQMFRINTNDLSQIKNLGNLVHLKISGNAIEDIQPLKGLTSLEALDMSNNNVEDISSLENLINLRELHLQENKITNINYIKNLQKLEHLDITKNPLIKLAPLSNLKTLQFLFVSEDRVSELKSFKNLTDTNINILPDW